MSKSPRCMALALLAPLALNAQQVPDTLFDVSVPRPAFVSDGPRVVIDEAHQNFHTATGRYLPFANLLRNDGFRVERGMAPFSAQSLRQADILVVSNALPADINESDDVSPAFTRQEAESLARWVRDGGSLLLIADHAPFGDAAQVLADQFGIAFGRGFVYDSAHQFTSSEISHSSIILYTRGNGLGTHAIIEGRDASERVDTVVAFTGQSMSVPPGATVLLRLSPTALEAPTREAVAAGEGTRVDGRAQAIAFGIGRGRVVVLGEAAMMSAQVARFNPESSADVLRMGMNQPGTDDKQFALNVVRWLARALP